MLHVYPGTHGEGIEVPCPHTAIGTSEGFLVCFKCARSLRDEKIPVKIGLPRNVDEVLDAPKRSNR